MGSPPQVRGKLILSFRSALAPWITPAGAGKTHFIRIVRHISEDHPRRCGENLSALSLMTACTGSPPQVRGKLIQAIVDALPQRITPAGAGKTRGLGVLQRAHEDHPRRCGENFFAKLAHA